MKNDNEMMVFGFIVAAIGAAIGIAKLLLSPEVLTWRLIVGRAIVTAALAMAAFIGLVWMPADTDPVVIVGVACVLASIGEQGLEKVLNKYLGSKT
jgi:hypothetical protein